MTALFAALLALWIVGFVVSECRPAFQQIGLTRFVTDDGWNPTRGAYGVAPMVAASVLIALGALLLALPLALAAAICQLAYAPPWLARVLRRGLELLAAVPSVVFGFIGLVTLVPWLTRIAPPGASLLAAALVLALMVLPTLTLMVEEALAGMPHAERAAAAALGLSRSTVVLRLALPRAQRGIHAAVLVSMGRALGETMAVLMVSGNVVQWPRTPFTPVRTLTANIALEMAYATTLHRSALFVSGLLLLATTVALLLVAAWRIAATRGEPTHA